MIKRVTVVLSMMALLLMSGCSSSVGGDKDAKGPSSGGDRTVGSLSGGETGVLLEGKSYNSIEIDLMKYLRDIDDRKKSYTLEMSFKENKVLVEADCYDITARYKLKGDELSFTRVSSPVTVNRATCKGFKDADNAVLAFFSSDYTILDNKEDTITLEATDLDASVTLKR